MQRSDSQSTACTINSSYTASTVVSGYSSATDFSLESTLPEDGTYRETSSYPDPCSFHDTLDANHMLSATGSQYQQSGTQIPQGLQLPSTLQLFSTQAGNEEAAWQATQAANSLIVNRQTFSGGGPFLVTSEAVEEALRRHQGQSDEEPVRLAVQAVLYQQLDLRLGDTDHFYHEIIRLLQEAAYQLQIRLQGPNVIDICYYAIAAVLADLTGDPEADNNGASSRLADDACSPDLVPGHASSSSEKEKFKCPYRGCKHMARRQADLDRHFKIMHLADDQKTRYLCDYPKCGRHITPFYRQDHFRDHLREYHREDLVRRGSKGDEEWWSDRNPDALKNGWWRCTRCLVKVRHKKNGYSCPGCKTRCEKERQQYRQIFANAGL
ncbi:hypothetical protein F5144DRAFT_499089 [Chaetomium tenue]|uniref:Uncharacterized protein n=1 Tax=Chaetomium tenue TaxID=1854479 RepID=A0ACB7NUZ1_9PEZI|nr:hypothetical protein F5144DRAFT_499089 [Chaetomium globosum]